MVGQRVGAARGPGEPRVCSVLQHQWMREGYPLHVVPSGLPLSIKLCKSTLLRIFILMISCNLEEEFFLRCQWKINIISVTNININLGSTFWNQNSKWTCFSYPLVFIKIGGCLCSAFPVGHSLSPWIQVSTWITESSHIQLALSPRNL